MLPELKHLRKRLNAATDGNRGGLYSIIVQLKVPI